VTSANIAYAEMIQKSGTFAGAIMTYQVVLPNGYDPAKAYPTVLVFPGGPQTLRLATAALENDWRREAERRGYIVISPATPDGSLFFERADRIFPAFLEMILRDYKVVGKLRLAGLSNGGLSAFHVASLYPQYFSTVIGYPGLLDGADEGRAQVVKSMCLFMHVGDRDTGWRSGMQEQAQALRARGFRIQYSVENGQDHVIRSETLGPRMFDEIESCHP
jgi:predicted esterase